MIDNGEKKESTVLKREIWVARVIPALILFSLWLDGWFFPLILLPITYVLFVEKKSFGWLGFSRYEIRFSLGMGVIIALVLGGMYYPIFLHYLYVMKMGIITIYSIFVDVIWYPIYEEVTYRSFVFSHFAKLDRSCLSPRNLIVNVFQSFLFLSVHTHHFSVPLVLLPVFFLGFMNGFLFLKIRNIYGCNTSHSALNGPALLLRLLVQVAA